MNLYDELSQKTVKIICGFFNGDNKASIYNYRTGSQLADMYSLRFKEGNYVVGVSRWCLCEEAMVVMANKNDLTGFFDTMLSFKNVKKEHSDSTNEEIFKLRNDAITFINSLLYEDDYELTDVSGRVYFSKIDDKSNLIGEGGFAKVYKIPGTNNVVKKLKEEFKGNASIVSRFKNEYILITRDLNGVDGIIRAFDYDSINISYTMEYCETDLGKYIEREFSVLSKEDKIDLILEIMNIMNEVHNKKVLHRDLSPKNIFIKNKKPIIADFGLGKAIDSSGRTYATIDTSCQGTLEYCDPRQFQGLGFADEQSDIYSLAKIINYIMTKKPEDFDHCLSIITTIATQSSLSARYHSIEEMIIRIKQSQKLDATGYYVADCITKIEKGIYDSSLDNYLLSFDGEDLISKCYEKDFLNAYTNLFYNNSYDGVLIQKLSSVHDRLESPIGLSFAYLDLLGNRMIDILKDNRNLSPALKDVIGKCIYDITCGVERWSVQRHLEQNYKKIESIYIEDSIISLKNRGIIR